MEFTEVVIKEVTGRYYAGICLVNGLSANFHVSFIRKNDRLHLWARIAGIALSEKWNSDEPVNWVYELAVAIKIIKDGTGINLGETISKSDLSDYLKCAV